MKSESLKSAGVCGCGGGGACGKRSTRNAQRSTLKGEERADTSRSTDESRLERLDRRVERLAVAMEMIALSAVVMVMAVLLWEWIALYRSLPAGTMRMFGSL